ncbi:MAG: hypothetical protein U9R60_08370 [Bacteroidota bacterium]|nr:hypothetical protein [Bacteroidota bacterium]
MKEWKKLYDLMKRIHELKPWEWMDEIDVFGVEDPETGVIGYVSIMGQLGEHYSIAVYLGQEGLGGLWSLHENALDFKPEMLLEIPQLQASFEDEDMLDPEDKMIIKKIGLSFKDEQAWPMFRSFRPGFFPWHLEAWEQKFLVHVLEQTIQMVLRVKVNPGLLEPEDENEDEYLVRKLINGSEWEDVTTDQPLLESMSIPLSISARQINLFKYLPLSRNIWEIGFSWTPAPVKDNSARPYYPYLLFVLHKKSEMILGHELLTPLPSLKEMRGTIPDKFLELAVRIGKRPEEIHVNSELLYQVLYPLNEATGLRIKFKQSLPKLENAMDHMLEFLGEK